MPKVIMYPGWRAASVVVPSGIEQVRNQAEAAKQEGATRVSSAVLAILVRNETRMRLWPADGQMRLRTSVMPCARQAKEGGELR